MFNFKQAGYIRKAGLENSSTERWLVAGRDLILVFLLETEAFLCLQRADGCSRPRFYLDELNGTFNDFFVFFRSDEDQ